MQALFSSTDKSKRIKELSAAIFVWRCKGLLELEKFGDVIQHQSVYMLVH